MKVGGLTRDWEFEAKATVVDTVQLANFEDQVVSQGGHCTRPAPHSRQSSGIRIVVANDAFVFRGGHHSRQRCEPIRQVVGRCNVRKVEYASTVRLAKVL
jgi:hypothetical protein